MGLLRLFLALSVISGHAQTTVFGFNGIGAWYAVNFFFIISGFYMAMVINEKYMDTQPIYFYKSRALRLYPTYYIGVLIAVLVSFDKICDFFGHLSFGAKLFFVFQNLFIFGQDLSYLLCAKTTSLECAYPVAMTINPPAWSLAVELCFYLVAPFILKSEKRIFFFILFGCSYLLLLNGVTFPLASINYFRPADISALNYYFYPSSFVFFGGGALGYHLNKKQTGPHYYFSVLLIVALSFTSTAMPFWHLLFISMAIPVLFKYTAKNRLDRSIGELSYPAYILHFPILLFFQSFTQSHPQYFKFISLGSWVAITSCAIGLLIYLLIEKKINIYRESKISVGVPSDGEKSPEDGRKNNHLLIALSMFFLIPITAISYIYSHQASMVTATSRTPYNLTDDNWVNGISRREAGFFVNSSPQNIAEYQSGKVIKFSNGDIRKIIRSEKIGAYLNVYLDGSPLDAGKVGFPNEIEIIK